MAERKRRPYQLKNAELRAMVDQLTAEAEAVYGQQEESELLRQMLTTSVRFLRDKVAGQIDELRGRLGAQFDERTRQLEQTLQERERISTEAQTELERTRAELESVRDENQRR